MGDRIQLNYAQLEESSQELHRREQQIESMLADLEKMLDAMDWEGEDRGAYQAHKAEWNTAMDNLNEILVMISKAVDNAKERYRETEMRNASSWG
ncbi:WXG100 family type VII secretion target [Natronoglycomyces albus]|uniref:ESAT-6-like protein n=1 Tax=Natronoglycomyces albus TaxID=2811108 RepID=A0A895XS37_9ACTN|nr:WXG100 family type VII secretion target [Natronoglycomyces albus]QSB06015.1 WXG100 family type VII secretion target [Natronoglycomyces albus]